MDEDNNLKLDGIMEQGYGIIPKKVMRDKNISVEAKSIYSYLCSYSGNGSTAFPSVSLICSDLGIGKNRFYKHRKELTDYGYVEITNRKDGTKYISNIYKLPLNPCIQFEDMKNEDIQFEDMRNEDTNKNNFTNNNFNKNNSNGQDEQIPYKKIIDYLNEQAGKKFKVTEKWKTLIRARWNEGQTYDDFIKVIDTKVQQWSGDATMDKYLRPVTLFGNKFDDYLNEYQSKKQNNASNSLSETQRKIKELKGEV